VWTVCQLSVLVIVLDPEGLIKDPDPYIGSKDFGSNPIPDLDPVPDLDPDPTSELQILWKQYLSILVFKRNDLM